MACGIYEAAYANTEAKTNCFKCIVLNVLNVYINYANI